MDARTARRWTLDASEQWEDRGVEGGGGYRYLSVRNADPAGGGHEVARVWVDEDDPAMLDDARLIAAAPAAVALLRKIVAAQERFFDRNENGSHDEFQQAADEYHGAVDEAGEWLAAMGGKG